jgi:hypothetical protein
MGETAVTNALAVTRLGMRICEGKSAYLSAHPWPHLIVQDALPDELVRLAYEQVDRGEIEFPISRSDRRERKMEQPDLVGAAADLLAILDSDEIVGALRELTGIPDLEPDPMHMYAGLQLTPPGGSKKVHVDFYRHPITKLYHRVNVLLYLNPNWSEANGGSLEMWPVDMKARGRQVLPVFNQLVLFESNARTPHGLPDPVVTDTARGRLVLSSYYYSHIRSEVPKYSTLSAYRARPQDSKRDGAASFVELADHVWQLLPAGLRNRLRPPR